MPTRESRLLIDGLMSRLQDMVVRVERIAPAPPGRLQLLRVTWERTSRDLSELAESDSHLSINRPALDELEAQARAVARQATAPAAPFQTIDDALQLLERIDASCRTLWGGGSRDFP